MTVTAKELGIDRLDVDTRMALVEEIWQGLFDELQNPPLTEAQRQELDRRVAHHETDQDAGYLIDEVLSRVNHQLRR